MTDIAHAPPLAASPGLCAVARRREELLARIAAAAAQRRTPAPAPLLMAVSKGQPEERVRAALEAGQRLFGENRVREARARWEPLRPLYPDLKLHLIGPLQTNKVKEAVAMFDAIETLDREKLAEALAVEMRRQARHIPCFVQVNTGEEPQKAGAPPRAADALIARARAQGLDIAGLMCIPPADEPPAPHFALLRKIADRNGLKQLSMGMSGDFEEAVRFGATQTRIGSALFGEREG